MVRVKPKDYKCRACGNTTYKWYPKCLGCDAVGTIIRILGGGQKVDRSKHTVTIPVSDYEELLAKAKYSPEEIEKIREKANAWQIYNPGPKVPCELHMSTQVPYWFNLAELHIYQNHSGRVVKKYKLVDIPTDEPKYDPDEKEPRRVYRQ